MAGRGLLQAIYLREDRGKDTPQTTLSHPFDEPRGHWVLHELGYLPAIAIAPGQNYRVLDNIPQHTTQNIKIKHARCCCCCQRASRRAVGGGFSSAECAEPLLLLRQPRFVFLWQCLCLCLCRRRPRRRCFCQRRARWISHPAPSALRNIDERYLFHLPALVTSVWASVVLYHRRMALF